MRIRKIKIGKNKLKNLPVFFNYIIANKQLKGDPHYHFNNDLKVYQDYIYPFIPISKI